MATIKYRKREFNPTQNQPGMSHCWYAESVIVNELDTIEIARLIEARTGVRRYEAQSVLASFVELINEECAQSMRIKLSDEKGQKFVSIYPKISGSINDKDVQANPEKYGGATAATEAMLTPDMLTVTLASTVGISASKQFAENASIQKVAANVTGIVDEDEENGGESQNGGSQNGGSNNGGTENGGSQNGGGTGSIDTGGGNTGGNGGSTDPDDGDEG
ncbi:MAG: hypothetical protein K6A32_07525 [Bacteroidales bacterium]|nr:hypothetical protein [Bacteroidales bacterium]